MKSEWGEWEELTYLQKKAADTSDGFPTATLNVVKIPSENLKYQTVINGQQVLSEFCRKFSEHSSENPIFQNICKGQKCSSEIRRNVVSTNFCRNIRTNFRRLSKKSNHQIIVGNNFEYSDENTFCRNFSSFLVVLSSKILKYLSFK